MALPEIRNPSGMEALEGKKISFRAHTRKEGKEIRSDSDVIVRRHRPDVVEVEEEAEEEVEQETASMDYEQIRELWAQKKEYHDVTRELGFLSQEGGQALVAIFGAEKVASALDEFRKGPIDQRTGLYALVKMLEGDFSKRQKVYADMERVMTAEAKVYSIEHDALTSDDDKSQHREKYGGHFAPTMNAVRGKKLFIHEFRMFDANAFSALSAVKSAVLEMINGDLTIPKRAAAVLQKRFDAGKFVEGVTKYGGLTQYLGERNARERAVEAQLEGARARRIEQLVAEQAEAAMHASEPFLAQLEALKHDEELMFGVIADPGAMMSEEAEKATADAMESLITSGQELVGDMEKRVTETLRSEFADEYAKADAFGTEGKRNREYVAIRRRHVERVSELEAPFQSRITKLAADLDRLFNPRSESFKSPETPAILEAAGKAFAARAEEIKKRMTAAVGAECAKFSEEMKKLVALDVFRNT